MIVKESVRNQIDKLMPELMESLKEVISHRSVIDTPKDGCPFGKGINDCLDSVLSICHNLGFRTYKDEAGYYGFAEIGEGPELIGVLGHLDVVPEGDLSSWNYPPYNMTIDNGAIYGRGTQDDKGPVLCCLYAVKALMDLGVNFNKRIRFIFGTDEENLWRGINRYKENGEEIPSMGITPDSEFFCVNAEKGLLQAILTCNNESTTLLKAGNAFNSVPDKAVFKGSSSQIEELKALADTHGYKYEIARDEICFIGKGVHSCNSPDGINAIARLAICLSEMGTDLKSVRFIADVIGEDPSMSNLFGDLSDISGGLTVNIGKLDIDEKGETLSLDIRIPVTHKLEEIVTPLKAKASEYGLKYEQFDWLAPIYVPYDHFLIRTLKEVYDEETGFDGKPSASGGATYARAIDNCVAFGITFPDSDLSEHEPNEHLSISDMIKAMNIYALALYKLSR